MCKHSQKGHRSNTLASEDPLSTSSRHIFSTKQTVEEYRTRDVESELGLSRPEFISLALLLGSDYTPGVRGVLQGLCLLVYKAVGGRQSVLGSSSPADSRHLEWEGVA